MSISSSQVVEASGILSHAHTCSQSDQLGSKLDCVLYNPPQVAEQCLATHVPPKYKHSGTRNITTLSKLDSRLTKYSLGT